MEEFGQEVLKCLERKFPLNDYSVDELGIFKNPLKLPHQPFSIHRLENIQRLKTDIPISYQKLNGKYWNTTSPKGRDNIEKWRKYMCEKGEYKGDTYVPNGDFVMAMLLLDYQFKISEKKFPQLTFSASYRNVMKYTCQCGLPFTKASEVQHKKSRHHKTLINKQIKEAEKPLST